MADPTLRQGRAHTAWLVFGGGGSGLLGTRKKALRAKTAVEPSRRAATAKASNPKSSEFRNAALSTRLTVPATAVTRTLKRAELRAETTGVGLVRLTKANLKEAALTVEGSKPCTGRRRAAAGGKGSLSPLKCVGLHGEGARLPGDVERRAAGHQQLTAGGACYDGARGTAHFTSNKRPTQMRFRPPGQNGGLGKGSKGSMDQGMRTDRMRGTWTDGERLAEEEHCVAGVQDSHPQVVLHNVEAVRRDGPGHDILPRDLNQATMGHMHG